MVQPAFTLGADPVYQFNTAGELRRAYIGGLLYKAERGQLVALKRQRSDSEAALVRHELTTVQTAVLVTTLSANLAQLRSAFEHGTYEVLGRIPHDCEIVARIKNWLVACSSSPGIANRPNVR